MPHIIVKHWPGPTEEQKMKLSEEIAKAVMATFGSREKSISVAIEEVKPTEWLREVYDPDIKDRLDELYKKPGYRREDL